MTECCVIIQFPDHCIQDFCCLPVDYTVKPKAIYAIISLKAELARFNQTVSFILERVGCLI